MNSDAKAALGRIKGAAIRDFIGWHIATFGAEPLQRAIRTLPESEQAEFDFSLPCMGVLASTWMPASTAHHVLDKLLAGTTRKQRDELALAGAEATLQGVMSGAQRIVFAVMTPSLYVKVANVAFRLNYDSGKVCNEILGPKRHRGWLESWKSHHPFLCRMNTNMKAGVYRAMGCEGVVIEERFCKSDGGSACGSIIRWQ